MNHWRPSTSGQRWKRRADAEPLTEERHHTKVQSGVKLGPKFYGLSAATVQYNYTVTVAVAVAVEMRG
ncbi:hypothetical protein FOQG_01350 [Fusarium oxysporum f. sp. raphani 54005]|uniref:Uncharacterized protein n=3 Tax=Fusarium oxysporum TaxID=5507 RepID=X0CW83_FUSOX|nr:hypothetical protein FOVG_09195 [Fusarium oxysporum f. sp. pisi HDV247]EXK98426.1 hypothetical protein FOQG_01350 [Fusarium oxysporum f. sp. raphani 54005]EXL88424.1 hypothetical protein FOPG_00737 [Fusarium oxysporum f. sp. conglutinans race 2 54008]